jgi:catechol 2,3-dioxygenase-like lactoylglutathione lyase family enzyme
MLPNGRRIEPIRCNWASPVSERAPGTGPVDHLAFAAVDCDAVKSRLVSRGLSFSESHVPGARLTQFFLHDPNGVKVEIAVAAPT